MTNILVPSNTPCIVPDFDPGEDMLVIALPDSDGCGLDHTLSIHYKPRADLVEVTLTLLHQDAKFIIRLPQVRQLDPNSIAFLSLEDARRLPIAPRLHDTATLTGHGLYPSEFRNEFGSNGRARKFAVTYKHVWTIDGAPQERFFDLSHPESELVYRISDTTDGAVYVIRFTEEAGTGEATDTYRSILICQTAPHVPHLKPSELTRWFASRLGSDLFRVVGWVYLGNEGQFLAPETGKLHRFGRINQSPRLALHGPIAGSIAISR
ncbi:hypothetical protein [Rhodalgimonas zhirmunskyi]|uniref:Uncharacterized protein n=1 Tax=Rhodalgimonas zhirmunskyi TaxID=2964767 RepID=A0AAJ1X622_9RHOB|nr:hypothetical protein [Rhodoalgimonas zhirmunskyi]MDQ2095076.1 hypothetical protein [Rhodoalgimonas zhirmunskyi]